MNQSSGCNRDLATTIWKLFYSLYYNEFYKVWNMKYGKLRVINLKVKWKMKIFLLLIYIFVYGTKCEYQHTGTTIQSKYKYFLHSNKQATGGTYIYEISFREHIKECIRMCDYLSSQCVAFNADKVQKMCYFTNTITGLQDANSGWTCVTKGEVCFFQKITSFLFVSLS